MRKNLQKILRALVVGSIILSLSVALPPGRAWVVLSYSQDLGLDLQPEPAVAKMDGVDVASGIANFIPKSSQEITSSVSKWLQASFVALKDRTILLCETGSTIEFSDYLFENAPHVNLPLLSHRQSAREPSPAG